MKARKQTESSLFLRIDSALNDSLMTNKVNAFYTWAFEQSLKPTSGPWPGPVALRVLRSLRQTDVTELLRYPQNSPIGPSYP